MSERMGYEDLRDGLVRLGIPADKAERRARQECGLPVDAPPTRKAASASIALPFRMVIPWSALVSDNDKERASAYRGSDGQIKPRKVLTIRYKTGKETIRKLAREIVGTSPALTIPLRFVGRVYRPSQHRNDASNFGKLVQDALSGIVYDDDTRLFHTTWIKVAETDVDRPRAEIEIDAL